MTVWEWVWKRGPTGNTTAAASLESACAAWSLLQSWERGDPLCPPYRQKKDLAGATWLFWSKDQKVKCPCQMSRNSKLMLHVHKYTWIMFFELSE